MDLEEILHRKMSDNNGGKGDKVVVVYQSLITQFELIRTQRSSSQQVVEFKGPGSQESDTRRHGASTIQLEIPSQGVSTDARTGVSTSVSRSARTSVTPMGFDYAHSGIGSSTGPGSVSGSVLKSRSITGRGIALKGKDSSVVRQWLENTPNLET